MTTSQAPVVCTVASADRPGIVAAVTAAIAASGGNILELHQHTDRDVGAFNARIEVDAGVDLDALRGFFDDLRASMGLTCTIHEGGSRPRAVVLCLSLIHI